MVVNNSAGGGADAADPRIAAIDVGSNSIRLVIAQVLPGGGYRVVDEERENTRLAGALVSTGRIDDQAIDQTLAALRHFLSIATGYGVEKVRAIATSAVREAANGGQFCARVKQELDLNIEVISSEEEAKLAFLSVARAFDVAGREVAVADIGGGSTELILATSGIVDQIYATGLGAVRITEECGVAGQCSEKQLSKLFRRIDRELKECVGKPPFTPSLLFGTGGTFTALASVMMAREGQSGQPLWGFRITRAEIRHMLGDLAALSLEKRRKVAGLNPQRADIIVAGLAIIERVLRHLKVNVAQVHTRGVRDGLLLTMIRRSPPPSVGPEGRRQAVEQFAASCGVDLSHARQVARIAGLLLEQLSEPLSIDPANRELIEAAAILANVGYLINFDGHHKHGYHLIYNSELAGFERRELKVLANVARYHRGSSPKLKHDPYRELNEEDRRRVAQLAAILRLALALDRTHQQQVTFVRATVAGSDVLIDVSAADDADMWAASRKVELFEKVFGRQVIFRTAHSLDLSGSSGAAAGRSGQLLGLDAEVPAPGDEPDGESNGGRPQGAARSPQAPRPK